MESQQASPAAAYAKKLADGGGKHEYDGMFSGQMRLGSRVEDYMEIFGRSGTSSIPVLDVPELNERKDSVETRSSRPDYAKIFGGFGEADFAMPYDELISRAEKEMKPSRVARAPVESRTQFPSVPEQSAFAERKRMAAEASAQPLDGGKHVNVLYHKTNSGGRMGKSGMTHVAQLHAIPGFTRLIDDNAPQSPEGGRASRYVLNDVHLHAGDGMKEARPHRRAYSGPLLFSNASGQHVEHHRTSSSISNDASFDASNRSSMKSKLGVPKTAGGSYSPPLLDGEVDASSAAATSAAAVRKAIEEAQAKIKIAKELMERKKEGRQGRSRPKVSNHGVKSEKREAKSAEKTYQYKDEAEELYQKDDTRRKQVLNGSLGQTSTEVRQVTLDFRDETKTTVLRSAHTVNHAKEATFSEVDSRRADTGASRSEQVSPEAASSIWSRPSMAQLEQEEKTKKVMVSTYENKWKEKIKPSVLQDKFENIMRMLRQPADVSDVEEPEKRSEQPKGDVGQMGSEAKHEEIKGRSNEAAAREEEERTVKVNSWLDNIAKGHKEQEDHHDEGEMEKTQSFDLREDGALNTSGEVDAGKTSEVRLAHDEGENRASASGREEEVKEKVEEEAKEDKHDNDEHGGESFSESVETERIESEVHQRLEAGEENNKVTRLNDNIEVTPELHKPAGSESKIEQVDEIQACGELAVRVSEDATVPSSGPKEIEREPETVEEAYSSAEESDSARADGAGMQCDEPTEPLLVDENGVCCSSEAAYNSNRHGATECERPSSPERHTKEATTRSEESEETVDDAEVSSMVEAAAADDFQSAGEEEVLPSGTESSSHAEPEKDVEGGATSGLEEEEEDAKIPTVNDSTSSLDEERQSDDGIRTSTSHASDEEATAEAAESSGEKTSKNAVHEAGVAYYETMQMQETEDKQSPEKDVEVEMQQQHTRKKEAAKEKDLEKERQRIAVERAIREARERAFAEAREKAEKAAAERAAAAEAERRAKASARERSERVTALEKAAMEAKLKAERAAVERATAEARERALEKALSEKASNKGRNYSDKSPAPSKGSTDQRYKTSASSSSSRYQSSANNAVPSSTVASGAANAESSSLKSRASSEKQQQMAERAAKALAEKNMRDLLVQKEQAERNRLAEVLDAEIKRWSSGKERNLRVLLSTLHYILGPDSGWQAIPRTDLNSATAVRKAYKKATLFVHPDKLQQRGASIRQKYVCEKVFELLKDAWSRFGAEDR